MLPARGECTQFVVEGLVPGLYIIPASHNAMLDGLLEGQDAVFALHLVCVIVILGTEV